MAFRRLELSALIFFILSAIFMPLGRATAQTYFYIGQPFDIAECTAHVGSGPCVNGSVTASVTFAGLPSGYSGTVSVNDVASASLNAANVISLDTGMTGISRGGTGFSFTNGNLDNPGYIQLSQSIGIRTPYQVSFSYGGDIAERDDPTTGTIEAYGNQFDGRNHPQRRRPWRTLRCRSALGRPALARKRRQPKHLLLYRRRVYDFRCPKYSGSCHPSPASRRRL